MISYSKKNYFLKIQESWFDYQFNFWDIFSLNVFYHIKNHYKFIPGIRNKSYTLELDLEQGTDQIFSNFAKQVRQQIKIAEKEGTVCFFHHDIDKFVEFFNDFALRKDTWTVSRRRIEELGEYIKLSFAVHNGIIIAAHSYMIDKEQGIVRHLHSATKRLDENYDKNLIGRANKYLTVNDIINFKEDGYKIFDFGGFAKDTKDKSLVGINNYKSLFGAKLVPCINYFSFNYWILKKIVSLFGLSGKL